MDTISKAITQLGDLFRSMTPGARLTAALLLLAVVVSLAYLFAGGRTPPDDYLFGGVPLSPGEVNRIEGTLLSAGIPVDISGNRVRVPAARRYEAMAAIVSADAMPLNFHDIMTDALSSGSLFEGSTKTKARVEAAEEYRLAMQISEFPWVEKATVSYDERRPNGLRREPLVTAAVTVIPTAGETVSPRRQKMIKQIIAGAKAGLTPEQVQVIDVHHSGNASESSSLELAAFTDNPYLRDKFIYEHETREKILGHLDYIPGVRVAVNVRLQRAAPAGRVGVVASGPGGPQPSQATPTTLSQTSLERDNFNSSVGYTQKSVQGVGLVPEDVKATIEIPIEWILNTVWAQKWKLQNQGSGDAEVPMPTDDELQRLIGEKRTQIQTHIETMLPDIERGKDPHPRVQVSFYETPEVEPLPERALTQTAIAWLATHWTTLGMFVVAVLSLLILRSIVKANRDIGDTARAQAPALRLDVPAKSGDAVDDDEEKEEEPRPKLRLNEGPTLKDELAMLVREDPDAAAKILRSWISRAA